MHIQTDLTPNISRLARLSLQISVVLLVSLTLAACGGEPTVDEADLPTPIPTLAPFVAPTATPEPAPTDTPIAETGTEDGAEDEVESQADDEIEDEVDPEASEDTEEPEAIEESAEPETADAITATDVITATAEITAGEALTDTITDDTVADEEAEASADTTDDLTAAEAITATEEITGTDEITATDQLTGTSALTETGPASGLEDEEDAAEEDGATDEDADVDDTESITSTATSTATMTATDEITSSISVTDTLDETEDEDVEGDQSEEAGEANEETGFSATEDEATDSEAMEDEAAGHDPGASAEESVHFATPTDGATVPPVFDVVMVASGLTVEPAGEVQEGTGHFHLLVDTDFIEPGEVIPTDDNHLHYGSGQLTTTLELEPGEHTLRLQFADGAHTALEGDQYRDEITVTVEEDAPARQVIFVEPADGDIVDETFTLKWAASGLIIEPSHAPSQENAGHLHILIGERFVEPGEVIPEDDTHLNFGGGQTSTELTLEPGVYVLRLQMADSDHVALEGEQYQDEIIVTVR